MEEERDHSGETGDTGGQEAGRENGFTKEQLLSSARFLDRRDIVDALLSPREKYTIAEVKQKIRKYMKGKVK